MTLLGHSPQAGTPTKSSKQTWAGLRWFSSRVCPKSSLNASIWTVFLRELGFKVKLQKSRDGSAHQLTLLTSSELTSDVWGGGAHCWSAKSGNVAPVQRSVDWTAAGHQGSRCEIAGAPKGPPGMVQVLAATESCCWSSEMWRPPAVVPNRKRSRCPVREGRTPKHRFTCKQGMTKWQCSLTQLHIYCSWLHLLRWHCWGQNHAITR